MRVMAAMSGGVDSSVAAARLVAEGHEVIGVHLALASTPTTLRVGSRGCCSLEDSGDARRVADVLGIPFYVWDFSDRFREDVVDPFINSYEMGETPNPCLRCNEKIKFQALLDRGIALGFDAVATGHYARLKDGELRRAIDDKKDQSYVLGVLNDEQLAHCLFPLGDTRKPDIRKEAEAAGLVTASKPDSHDICFIPDGNTKAFLGNHIGVRSGDLKDRDGNVIGHHDGIYGFPLGSVRGSVYLVQRPTVNPGMSPILMLTPELLPSARATIFVWGGCMPIVSFASMSMKDRRRSARSRFVPMAVLSMPR